MSRWWWIGLALLASSASAGKVGYVDMKYLLDMSPQALLASERLQREFKPREQAINAQREQLALLNERFRLETDPERKRELEQALGELERELRGAESRFREDLNLKKNNEYKRVRRIVIDAINAFAVSDDWDLIVSEGVLFASEEANLTEAMMKALQQLDSAQ